MNMNLLALEEQFPLLRAVAAELTDSLDRIVNGMSETRPSLFRSTAERVDRFTHEIERFCLSLRAHPDFLESDLPARNVDVDLNQLGTTLVALKTRSQQRARAREELQRASDVIEKVLRLRQTDDSAAASLEPCRIVARSLRELVGIQGCETAGSLSPEISAVAAGTHPLCAVLRLVLEAGRLDDREWSQLHEQVQKTFGRGLSTAIARARIVLPETDANNRNIASPQQPPEEMPTAIGAADTAIPNTSIPTKATPHASPVVRPAAPLKVPPAVKRSPDRLPTAPPHDVGQVRDGGEVGGELSSVSQLEKLSNVPHEQEKSPGENCDLPTDSALKSKNAAPLATGSSRGQSQTQDFRGRIASLARQALKEPSREREPLVAQLSWMLLIDGRYGLAYHLARTLEQRGEIAQAFPPSTAIRAIAMAQEVCYPSGDIARQLGEAYRQLPEVNANQSEEMRSAMYFLRLAGSLRPALVAPSAGASKVLHGPRTLEQLSATHNYSVRLSMYGDQTQALDLNLFRKRQTEAEWRAESAKLNQEIEAWRASAAAQVVSYRPTKQFFLQSHWSIRKRRGISGTNLALQSWRKWQLVVALSEELLAPVVADRAEEAGRVRNEIERLSDVTLLGRKLEGQSERDGRMGARPEAKAPLTELMRAYLGTALGFARRWTSLCRSRPGTRELMIPRDALDLKDDVLRRQAAVLKELLAFRESIRSLPVIASITCCCRAVMQVGDLFDPRASLIPVERDSRQVLGEELLKIPTLSMDEQWNPETTGQVLEQEILDYLGRGETSWKMAFELRCQQRDHRATGRILGLSVWNSATELERLIALREHLLRQCDEILDRDLAETRLRVQSALKAGFLAAHDIAEIELRMAEVDEDSGLRLEYAKCHRRLQRVRDDVERIVTLETESLRRRQASLLNHDASPEQRLIDESIRRGDYGAVRTHLNLLAASVSPPQKEWAV